VWITLPGITHRYYLKEELYIKYPIEFEKGQEDKVHKEEDVVWCKESS